MRGGVYGGGAPRLTSRSATATPTGSPKRRHLPQIPAALQQTSFSRVRQVTTVVNLFIDRHLIDQLSFCVRLV